VRKTGRNFAAGGGLRAVKTIDGTKVHKDYHGGEKRFGGIGDYVAFRSPTPTGRRRG